MCPEGPEQGDVIETSWAGDLLLWMGKLGKSCSPGNVMRVETEGEEGCDVNSWTRASWWREQHVQRPFDVLEERRKATMCGREHPNQEEGRRRSVLERQARVRSVIPKEGDIALSSFGTAVGV